MKFKIAAFFLLGIFVLGSCKKKDSPITKTQLLNQTPWIYNSAGIDQDRNGTVDYPLPSTSLQPCMIDNTYIFNTNGTGVINEGATKCDAAAPQTSPFSWSFADNETNINLQSTALFGLGGKFKVLELSATAFNMSKDTTLMLPGIPLPMNVGIIINLKH